MFLTPSKRVYVLHLATSLCIAYVVFLFSGKKQGFFKYILNKKVWTNHSARIDYGLIVFNSFFKVILIAPILVYSLYISFYTTEWLNSQFGYPQYDIPQYAFIIAYTLTLMLANDFMSFFIHYLMHKYEVLWEFHKIHHSATTMNPLTQYRLHPVELMINNIKGTLVIGFVSGFFNFISGHQISVISFLGVNIFNFAFLALGANLRHSHVKLKYPHLLEKILISPFQHQIHHSADPKHFNKNMGSKFALWDWMFGTLVRSKNIEKLKFGLGTRENLQYNSLAKNLYMPFYNLWNRLARIFSKN